MGLLQKVIGSQVIGFGASGAAVAAIQMALHDMGYPLTGTGYFGVNTQTAIEAFQRKAGLQVDGKVGPATAAAIDGVKTDHVEIDPVPLWLEAGIGLLGTAEGPGARDNPLILDWAKEEGGEIAKEYTHDSIPWCSLFVGHCMTLAGKPGTKTLWALDWAGKWPSIRLPGPAVGAIAPMVRSGGGHVIIVDGRSHDGNVVGLGGNQSDKVCYAQFPLSRLNQGFWWPASAPLPNHIGFNALPVVNSDGKVSTAEA